MTVETAALKKAIIVETKKAPTVELTSLLDKIKTDINNRINKS